MNLTRPSFPESSLHMNKLPSQVVATVKSTAPAVAVHGRAIVARMYELMFAANPEVRELFNPSHMTPDGQIGALAEAVSAYAANIDQPAVLAAALERMSQKHTAFDVRPEHYAIVGRHLIQAIKDVFSAAATPEVVEAWTAAYGFLAGVLISREQTLYDAQSGAPGGWTGLRNFRVDRKVPESEVITSFYLVPEDGGPLPAFRPGQYVTVRSDELAPAGAYRNYSLSDRPETGYFRITVRREAAMDSIHAAGLVSNHLHDNVRVGDTVRLMPPAGNFFLREPIDRPVVLLSGGVGLTPLLSMLNELAHRGCGQPVYYIHGANSSEVHACRDEVRRLCAGHPHFNAHVRYKTPTAACDPDQHYDSVGTVDLDLVRSAVPVLDGDYYLCGPKMFMRGLYHGLIGAGVPENNIHFEFFGPATDITV